MIAASLLVVYIVPTNNRKGSVRSVHLRTSSPECALTVPEQDLARVLTAPSVIAYEQQVARCSDGNMRPFGTWYIVRHNYSALCTLLAQHEEGAWARAGG